MWALAHEVGALTHILGARVGGGRPPQRKPFLRGFQRFVEIGLAGMRQMRQRLLGRRIDDVLALAAAAVNPLAVDIEREIGIHGVLVVLVIAAMVLTKGLASFEVGFTPLSRGKATSQVRGGVNPRMSRR